MDELQREVIDRFAEGNEVTSVSSTRPFMRGSVTGLGGHDGGVELRLGTRQVLFDHLERPRREDSSLSLWVPTPIFGLTMPDDSILMCTGESVLFAHTWEWTLGLIGLVGSSNVREILSSGRVRFVVAVQFCLDRERLRSHVEHIWVGVPNQFSSWTRGAHLSLEDSKELTSSGVIEMNVPAQIEFPGHGFAYMLPSGGAFYLGAHKIVFFLTEVPK